MAVPIGAFSLAPPTDAILPAPVPAIDPWTLRDGRVDAETRKAALNPDAPIWRQLFSQWAAKRGRGKLLYTPQFVAPDRTAKDALFDLLRIYDVYGARIVGNQHGLTLEAPSAVPADNDVSLVLNYDPYNKYAARLTLHNGHLLQGTTIRVEVVQLHDQPSTAVDVWEIRDGHVEKPGTVRDNWIVVVWGEDGTPILHASASVAALGRAFRVYAISTQLHPGTTLSDVEATLDIVHGGAYSRSIPMPYAVLPGTPSIDSQLYKFVRCSNEGASEVRRLRGRVTVFFDLAAGTLEFDDAGCFLHGPASAPAALFLDGNEQWSRAHSPVLCSPAETQPDETVIAPGATPPESAARQRFGHVGRMPRRPATPLVLTEKRAYITPGPLRHRLRMGQRATWLQLQLSELHPDAARMENNATAHLIVGDFDRALRAARIDAVHIELVLAWRAGPTQPLNFRSLPLRFQLVHAEAATYAYCGLPDVIGGLRSSMPYAAHLVPTGY